MNSAVSQPSKALFWDLDGTLADTREDIADSLNSALRGLGKSERSFEEIVSFIGDGLGELISRAVHPDRTLAEECMHLFRSEYRKNMLNKTTEYPGTSETLQFLAENGWTMNVITNKNRDFSVAILDGLGLLPYFSEVIGGDTLPVRKPAPDAILSLKTAQNLDLTRSFMIGDHHTDMDCGSGAGVSRIFCTFGMGILSGRVPDFTADSFSDIKNIIINSGY